MGKNFGQDYEYAWGNVITVTPDDGYILAGYVAQELDENILYLLKTDGSGNVQWEKTFGVGKDAEAFDIIISTDGGYIIAGEEQPAGSNAYLIKTDANGNLQWEKTFGETASASEVAEAVALAPDGGYVLAGGYGMQAGTKSNIYLIKTDANGNLQWEKTFAQTDTDNYLAKSITTTSDGSYLLAGYIQYPDNSSDIYLIKIDVNGNLLWEKTFGGGVAYSIISVSDDEYVVTGRSSDNDSSVLIKIDVNGNLLWEKTLRGTRARSVESTEDCGYIVGGETSTGIYFFKTDAEGNFN